jgi:hypothetical protein
VRGWDGTSGPAGGGGRAGAGGLGRSVSRVGADAPRALAAPSRTRRSRRQNASRLARDGLRLLHSVHWDYLLLFDMEPAPVELRHMALAGISENRQRGSWGHRRSPEKCLTKHLLACFFAKTDEKSKACHSKMRARLSREWSGVGLMVDFGSDCFVTLC